MSIRIIPSILLMLVYNFCISQSIKNYTGNFEYNGREGTATFKYFTDKNGTEIKHGNFVFTTNNKTNTYKVTGNYNNNKLIGIWTTITSWSSYNQEEHDKSDLIFYKVNEYVPFIEITKKEIIPWDNGNIEGKQIILYTRKESWGSNGGGQKLIHLRKEKIWKKNTLTEFSFEMTENNIKTDYIKGKYITLNGTLFYDGEWNGLVKGKSIFVKFDKGNLVSKMVKNISSGKIIEKQNHEVDQDIIKANKEPNNISIVYYENPNAISKLKVSKLDSTNFEFEVIINNATKSLPSEYFEPLQSRINGIEVKSPYDYYPLDETWQASSNQLTKKYLSNKRENFDLFSISVDDNNATKLFSIVNESNIEYIAEGSSYFTRANNYKKEMWLNDKPSYFGRNLYLRYLLFTGKAQKLLRIFEEAKNSADFKMSGYGVNDFGQNLYFISLCLAGDTNYAKTIVQNNLTRNVTLENEDPNVIVKLSWCEEIIKQIQSIIPLLSSTYSVQQLNFIKAFPDFIEREKQVKSNSYFENLKTVRIGENTWMKSVLEPENLNINLYSFTKYENDAAFININSLTKKEINHIESNKWRFPTLKEIRNFFSRNLSDYNIDLPVDYNNAGLVGIDEKRNLFVYFPKENIVKYKNPDNKFSISGYCRMLKK